METLIKIFEFVGIFAFAISGSVVAMRERMDIFGVCCVACISALGGGVLRDVVADLGVPAFFSSYPPVVTVFAAAAIALIFRERLILGTPFVLLDALGLSVFVISAGVKGIESGYSFMLYIFVSTITGVGGGILRDIVCNKKPDIFQRDIYTLAGILGAVILWIIYPHTGHLLSMSLSMSVIIIVRMVCYFYNINLPAVRYRRKVCRDYVGNVRECGDEKLNSEKKQ